MRKRLYYQPLSAWRQDTRLDNMHLAPYVQRTCQRPSIFRIHSECEILKSGNEAIGTPVTIYSTLELSE